jgi:hypothetical protein
VNLCELRSAIAVLNEFLVLLKNWTSGYFSNSVFRVITRHGSDTISSNNLVWVSVGKYGCNYPERKNKKKKKKKKKIKIIK